MRKFAVISLSNIPISMSAIFTSQTVFLTRLVTSSILLSTSLRAGVVAKPVRVGITFNPSDLSFKICFFLTSPLVSDSSLPASSIFFSRSDVLVLHCVFKTNLLVLMALTLVTNFS